MAYRNYFRSVLNDNFKILTWVLIFFIAITPNFIFFQSARASTYLGGWTITNKVMLGASLLIDATKTVVINGANVVKTSNAVIKPTATQVAKMIVKTGAVLAVDLAIKSLIGAVDYVMDNANNQVVYQPASDPKLPTIPKIWTYQGYHEQVGVHSTANAACQASLPYISNKNPTYLIKTATVSNETATSATCAFRNEQNQVKELITLNYINNPYYDPAAQKEPEQKTIPYTTVAQEIIDQAETDQRPGAYVGDVANDLLANDAATQSDVETQLNTNAKTQTSESASAQTTPKDPAAPEAGSNITISFPVFCSWAPVVCETAQSALDFMTDFSPDQDSSEVTVQQDNTIIFDDSQRFNFSSSCPSPEQFSVSFFGVTQNLEFSYQPLCNFMNMIKPFVVAGSYLIGAYIVMGLSRGSAD